MERCLCTPHSMHRHRSIHRQGKEELCLAGPACSHFAQLFRGKNAEEDEQALQVVFQAYGVEFLTNTAKPGDLQGGDHTVADQAGCQQLIGCEQLEHQQYFAEVIVEIDAAHHTLNMLGNLQTLLGHQMAL